jgi:hypothetical protein
MIRLTHGSVIISLVHVISLSTEKCDNCEAGKDRGPVGWSFSSSQKVTSPDCIKFGSHSIFNIATFSSRCGLVTIMCTIPALEFST